MITVILSEEQTCKRACRLGGGGYDGVLAVADLGGGGGCGRTPLGVLQKNSWSTNFENSEDSRQHDYYYYYYQFLPCS